MTEDSNPISVQAHAITWINSEMHEQTLTLKEIEQHQEIVEKLREFVKERITKMQSGNDEDLTIDDLKKILSPNALKQESVE